MPEKRFVKTYKEENYISNTETESIYKELSSFALKSKPAVASPCKQGPDPGKQFKCAIAVLCIHGLRQI